MDAARKHPNSSAALFTALWNERVEGFSDFVLAHRIYLAEYDRDYQTALLPY